ncbi:cysteine desulfurase NifS [Salipaludibacillus keqinensis]|uniref:cysteine desulfurase n=1 Tax=Salipaludibacillus keqinensis TaxID=2045207 RepID=A0A323TA95_9BACI|nr:cysteine desulfurase family protein [Salipaludibacillus keqinensis]PYZ91950.1 cysteine desulfurase NifS [Salipaludibacillus keqinensis]
MNQIYLDYNASTPIAPEVQAVMMPFFSEHYGNPSALHFAGREGKKAVEMARYHVASLLNASANEIVFTSGGSESNNHVLKGVFGRFERKKAHIITTTIEHPAVLNPCHYLEKLGAKVTYIGVDRHGKVDPSEVEAAIRKDTILISVMHSNNEVGTIQPISEVGKIAKKNGILFHTDASQSVGKVELDVKALNVDFLTVAGHKVYAPKGIGALYIREGVELEPLIHGAGHENGRRAGTENVMFVVGLGEACKLAKQLVGEANNMHSLREYFWGHLQDCCGNQISLNGHPVDRLPNTLSVNFLNQTGQEILASLPQIAASTGSACHANEITLSPVLKAMGVKESVGKGAVRFSLGRYTTKEEIDEIIRLLKKMFY